MDPGGLGYGRMWQGHYLGYKQPWVGKHETAVLGIIKGTLGYLTGEIPRRDEACFGSWGQGSEGGGLYGPDI